MFQKCWTLLACSAFAALFCLSCKLKSTKAQIYQETDDRLTSETKKLVDVGSVFESMVNERVNGVRKKNGIVNDQISEEIRKKFLDEVGKELGTYVKGTGITPLDIVQSTNLEIDFVNELSLSRNEYFQATYQESRYHNNPVGGVPGLPGVGGVLPSNMNTKMADQSIAGVVNLNGVIVGIDKIAHLFAVSKKFFNLDLSDNDAWNLGMYLEGHPKLPMGEWPKYAFLGLRADKAWGVFGVYGTLVTGVASEADMWANMFGLRFYQLLSVSPASYRFNFNSLCRKTNPCLWYLNEQNVPNIFVKGFKVDDSQSSPAP